MMKPETPLPWYPYEHCDGWTAIVDNPPMPRPICVFMDQGTEAFQAVGPEAEMNLRYAIHAANTLPQLESEVARLRAGFQELIDKVKTNGKLVGYQSEVLDRAEAVLKGG